MRGEARLEPLVFIWQYVLLVPPSIMFVSGLAILFESVPFLSGKFGDVAYFFLWAMMLGFVAAMIENGKTPGLAAYFDFSGFGFMLDTLRRTVHTTQMSIGRTAFDPAKRSVRVQRSSTQPRLDHAEDRRDDRAGGAGGAGAAVLPSLRSGAREAECAEERPELAQSFRRVGEAARPRGVASSCRAEANSLAGAAWTDAMMTLTSSPLIVVIAVGFAIAGLARSAEGRDADRVRGRGRSHRRRFVPREARRHDRSRLHCAAAEVGLRLVEADEQRDDRALVLLVPSLRLIVARPSSAP